MKTIEDLVEAIETAKWFHRLGTFESRPGFIGIPDLKPWGLPESLDSDQPNSLADTMSWLPTSRDQDDPLFGKQHLNQLKKLGMDEIAKSDGLRIYSAALKSLRKVDKPALLEVGPHNFTEAAKGAALYASRRAVYEILIGESQKWCEIVSLFKCGYWPCGILPNKTVVVL